MNSNDNVDKRSYNHTEGNKSVRKQSTANPVRPIRQVHPDNTGRCARSRGQLRAQRSKVLGHIHYF